METILHITDIHFGWQEDNASQKAERTVCLEAFLVELSKLEAPWKPTIVCLTGDVAWRGAPSDYNEAQKWLDLVMECCGLDYQRLIACPGNHDVIRERASKIARPTTPEEADQVLALPLAEQYGRSFSGYTDFCKKAGLLAPRLGEGDSYLVGQRMLRGLRFVTLNSAWFAKDDHDNGKLWLGLPHLKNMEAHHQLPLIQSHSTAPVTVALMHHPPEWLHPDERQVSGARQNTVDYLALRSHILLTGHTHAEVRKANRIAEGVWHFTGGSTYAGASHFNSFRLLQINADHLVYRSFEFDPRSADNTWKSSDAVRLPLLAETKTEQPKRVFVPQPSVSKLREALKADAARVLQQKSRLLRPVGVLPRTVSREVSIRVSPQRPQFNLEGRLIRIERSEQILPFYEATRRSRRTLLLGDLASKREKCVANQA